jgi:hypothetical protein
MGAKETMIRDAEQTHQELREVLKGIPTESMSRPWLGTWGVRDIVAHISGWHQEMVPALERIGRGEKPYPDGAYDDFDAWNARFVAARASASTEQLLGELDSSHRAFLAAAGKLGEEQFGEKAPARGLIDGVGPAHYREHTDQIREWRGSQRG